MAALREQKIGEGKRISRRSAGYSQTGNATRGARYSREVGVGGELKQRDAGSHAMGGKRDSERGGRGSRSREFKLLRIRHEQIRRKRS